MTDLLLLHLFHGERGHRGCARPSASHLEPRALRGSYSALPLPPSKRKHLNVFWWSLDHLQSSHHLLQFVLLPRSCPSSRTHLKLSNHCIPHMGKDRLPSKYHRPKLRWQLHKRALPPSFFHQTKYSKHCCKKGEAHLLGLWYHRHRADSHCPCRIWIYFQEVSWKGERRS